MSLKELKNVIELTENVFHDDQKSKKISLDEISENIFGRTLDL